MELSTWTPGRPSGTADTVSSVVSTLFLGCAKPLSVSTLTKDDVVVLLMSEGILLPPFVFALVNAGTVVLTPTFAFSEKSF